MRRALILAGAVMALATPALAHSWYSDKSDPVYHTSCCGGTDCAMWKIEPGALSAEETGLRVRLTAEQAAKINKLTKEPIDALVTYDRVQPSEDGNWHLCIMTMGRDNSRGGIYCLFSPPNI